MLVAVGADGYPDQRWPPTSAVDGDEIILTPPHLGDGDPTSGGDVHLVFSHIRPQPGVGYDERNYVEFTGRLDTGGARWRFTPASARGWSEADIPFMELCERALPQARRYLASLSDERGVEVKPDDGLGLTKFFLATRLPFLTATLVPVVLGVAAAGLDHHFNIGLALLTLVGAIAVHLGLNVANDVFDALSGADDANVNPTMFSGGSRVIQYGLVSLRQMAMLAAACYAVAIGVGLGLAAISGTGLLWLGIAGRPDQLLLHRAAAEAGPPRAGRGGGGAGLRPDHGAGRLLRADRPLRPAAAGALDPGGAAGDADPLRQRDPRPGRRRPPPGKRTLVVRLRREAVLGGYAVSAALAYIGGGRRGGPRRAALADAGWRWPRSRWR